MSPTRFKHMSPAEAILWSWFLAEHGRLWDRFDEDVRVGVGHDIAPDAPDVLRRLYAKVSTHRLDVVGYKGAAPTIFEVKERASLAALGAGWLYPWLYARTFPADPAAKVAIVTGLAHPEVALFCAAHGIALYNKGDTPGMHLSNPLPP